MLQLQFKDFYYYPSPECIISQSLSSKCLLAQNNANWYHQASEDNKDKMT